MDFSKVVNERRSVRKFLDTPVPREVLHKIVQAGIEAPSGCNMQLRQYVIVDDPAVMEHVRPCSAAIDAAPAAIVVLVDPSPTAYGEFWIQDASAAMENMLLAAVDAGYAGCWVEGALRRCEAQIRELLQVPAELRVWNLMPVGKPAVSPARPPKSDPGEIVHINKFGRKE